MLKTAVIDLDFCKYAAAAVGEERSILVVHKQSGDERKFKTRTEFYGRGKNKDGGWLGEVNLPRTTPYTVDDFIITDVQTPQPLENTLHCAKTMVENVLVKSGLTRYKAFLGKGDSFRVDRSTLLKYKGQRGALLKPIHLDAVTDYLEKKFNAEIVTHYEVDDKCVMECYKQPRNILVGIDKDFYGCPVNFFNAAKNAGTINCDTFGKLHLNEKKEVKGYGRMFLYYQTCSADASDNYSASCMSDVKWGPIAAYNALVDCKNDKEAWKAIETIFKKLYPEPKEVVGWRGDSIAIDWQYVLNECFDMARMLRFENDVVVATDVLKLFNK